MLVYAVISGLIHFFLHDQKIPLERGFMAASLWKVSAFREIRETQRKLLSVLNDKKNRQNKYKYIKYSNNTINQ